jgi:hypothetical protein
MDAAFAEIQFNEAGAAEANLAILRSRLSAKLWERLPTLLGQLPGPDDAQSEDSGGGRIISGREHRAIIGIASDGRIIERSRISMTIEQQVIKKLRDLSPEKQEQVLVFLESLKKENGAKPRRSLLGLWADLNIHISEEDLCEARREMWGNFPRDPAP